MLQLLPFCVCYCWLLIVPQHVFDCVFSCTAVQVYQLPEPCSPEFLAAVTQWQFTEEAECDRMVLMVNLLLALMFAACVCGCTAVQVYQLPEPCSAEFLAAVTQWQFTEEAEDEQAKRHEFYGMGGGTTFGEVGNHNQTMLLTLCVVIRRGKGGWDLVMCKQCAKAA